MLFYAAVSADTLHMVNVTQEPYELHRAQANRANMATEILHCGPSNLGLDMDGSCGPLAKWDS